MIGKNFAELRLDLCGTIELTPIEADHITLLIKTGGHLGSIAIVPCYQQTPVELPHARSSPSSNRIMIHLFHFVNDYDMKFP